MKRLLESVSKPLQRVSQFMASYFGEAKVTIAALEGFLFSLPTRMMDIAARLRPSFNNFVCGNFTHIERLPLNYAWFSHRENYVNPYK